MEKLKYELDEAELGMELQSSKLAAWENTDEAQVHKKYQTDLEKIQEKAEKAAIDIKQETKELADAEIARVKEDYDSQLAALTEENGNLHLVVTDLMNTLNSVGANSEGTITCKEAKNCYSTSDNAPYVQLTCPSLRCACTQTEVN